MTEQIVLCGCLDCTSTYDHGFGGCDNEAIYYVEIHMVDNCHLFEGGSSKSLVCLECFHALTASANWFIKEGMDGRRVPRCAGEGCDRYLVRLKSFFDVVEHAASYIADRGN